MSLTKKIVQSTRFNQTVAEIVRATGAKPNTVRVVLRRAAVKGVIHIERFYRGKSAKTIKVISHDEGIEARLNGLICGLCGSAK
jgi:predicted transcriptional regulator